VAFILVKVWVMSLLPVGFRAQVATTYTQILPLPSYERTPPRQGLSNKKSNRTGERPRAGLELKAEKEANEFSFGDLYQVRSQDES
jgi:hypothetical protein